MYGQFEQVVDRFNDTSTASETTTTPSSCCPPPQSSCHQQQQTTLSTSSIIMTDMASSQQPRRRRIARPLEFSSSGCSSNGSGCSSSSGEESDAGCSFSDCGEPLGYRLSRLPAGNGRASSRSISSGQNPLLETISVIGDLCDDDSSDDCVDAGGPSYAGSNSVDSGYKSSCCPTPVPAKQQPQSTTAATASSNSTTQLLDLDHLTSLRRTLLTAIERYDADSLPQPPAPAPAPASSVTERPGNFLSFYY